MSALIDNTAAQVIITVTLFIVIVIALIGNGLIMMIILTNKSMKTPMNYLLVNLAVADMMMGLFLTPQYVFIHLFTHPDGLTGTIICKLLTGGNFAWVGGVASSLSLVAICFERYFAIVYPFSIKFKLNMGKLKYVIVICWLSAVVVNVPLFLTIVYQKEDNFCIEKWPNQKWITRSYSMLWVIFLGFIPIAIMVVLYSKIIYTLWFKRSEHQVQGAQLAMLKSRKRVTKMVVIVSVIYAVCWLPVLLSYSLYHFGIHSFLPIVPVITCVLAACNSAVNPFIYGLQSEKFQRHFKELVCCKKRFQNQISDGNRKNNFARNGAYYLQTQRKIDEKSV